MLQVEPICSKCGGISEIERSSVPLKNEFIEKRTCIDCGHENEQKWSITTTINTTGEYVITQPNSIYTF